MNVIFLDIDGVLNHEKFYDEIYEKWTKHGIDTEVAVDVKCVERLINFLKESNVKLVISSSWRYNNVENTLKSFIQVDPEHENIAKINPYVVGVTKRMTGIRGKEIEEYINNSENHIEKYAILDDDIDMLEKQYQYFIHVNHKIGLTDKDIENLWKIFKE